MAIENCRTVERKKLIVEAYDLRPLVHIKMVDGQESLVGCCGRVIDRYYHFQATPKNGGDAENFIVGYDCAEQLLDMTGQPYLPLFNPLGQHGRTNSAGEPGNGGKGNSMAPVNRELSDAIHLLCMSWKGVPRGRLLRSLEFIRKAPTVPTQNFAVVALNEVISKDSRQRTLTEMIDDLRVRSPGLRAFDFPLMEQVLIQENQTSLL